MFLKSVALGLGLMMAVTVGCDNASNSTGTSASATISSFSASLTSDELSSDVSAGNLQLLVTSDASPRDVADLLLSISQIELHQKDGDFMVISNEAATVVPAQLVNGVVSSLANVSVGAGNYDAIRVTFASASATLPNGDKVEVDFAANASQDPVRNQIIARIPSGVAVASDAVTHLALKFATLPPRQGRGPSILPRVSVANLDTDGVVSGVITASADSSVLANAFVELAKDRRVVGSALTDAQGKFVILGLEAGEYEICVTMKDYERTQQDLTIAAAAEAVGNIALSARTLSHVPEQGDEGDRGGDRPEDRGRGPEQLGGVQFR